jgi:cell division protein FtsB
MAKTRGWLNGKRLLAILAALGIAYFAIEGGEYGTSDLISQGVRKQRMLNDIDSLTRQIDSLEQYRKQLLNDPVLQERIAREQFGMVRSDKELVYRFTDSTK